MSTLPNLLEAVDMGDSQQPKPAVPQFEVPDLELEPVPRRAPAAPLPVRAPTPANTGQNLFDDAFAADGPTIDLGVGNEQYGAVHFGGGANFDAFGDLELEGNAQPSLAVDTGEMPHAAREAPATQLARTESAAHSPSGQAPAREHLAIDALEISLLAKYGDPPKSAYATPAYAYRVFTRQRELKSALRPLEAERERAEAERESTLAELGRALRLDVEENARFKRLFAPLVELEQVASQRGQALSSVNAELTAQASALDAELEMIATQLDMERAREGDAVREQEERVAAMKRAEAKIKRVQIEIRAVTQVAEQKLGPQGGTIPEPEAGQLATLRERAAAVQPEVDRAKADLRTAKIALDQASARVAATSQSERLVGRKKQALVAHYQQELGVRARSMNESEQAQRAAFADIGRALLAARAGVAVPEPWLERVRSKSARSDALLLECERHLRALDAYDRPRAAQGVRLVVTLAAIVLFLIALKLAL